MSRLNWEHALALVFGTISVLLLGVVIRTAPMTAERIVFGFGVDAFLFVSAYSMLRLSTLALTIDSDRIRLRTVFGLWSREGKLDGSATLEYRRDAGYLNRLGLNRRGTLALTGGTGPHAHPGSALPPGHFAHEDLLFARLRALIESDELRATPAARAFLDGQMR